MTPYRGCAPFCLYLTETKHKRPGIQLHDCRYEAAIKGRFGSIGWHTFRHKYRTLLSEAYTPLDVQQKLWRLADIRTTKQYGDVPHENKRTANTRVVRVILTRKSAR